ncbi:MAG: SusE domain-containing protein [Bacteroidota bacterium]|nr:SusE domain-containing protein [Bacteroidota bacterium]
MKNILKILLFSFTLIITLFSCKKDEHKDYFEGGTAPVLTADRAVIPMSYATQGNVAVKLSWTNPNYQFTTGLSSQDVSYLLEVDTTGANFTNPNRKQLGIASDLSITLTQADVNDYLLNQLNLAVNVPHNIEFRITASLVNNSVPITSNVLKFTITPYVIPPKITPPSTNTLFIVGSATPGGSTHGWDNPISQTVSVQQFTRVSATFYTITLPLIGGGEYKLIGSNGSWNEQWSVAVADDPTKIYGGDFVFNGQNCLAPPTSGNYKIDVDFQRGKFTVTPQ